MTEVGSAYVSILPSTKGFSRKLSGELSGPADKAGQEGGRRAGEGFSRGFTGPVRGALTPLRVIGGAMAAVGAIHVFKGFIGEAQESRRVGALTAQVIKTTGSAAHVTAAQVSGLAASISNKTGVDDEAIQSGANLLLTFTNVKNEVGKGNDIFNQATQTITDMGAALGQDASSSAIQLGKALNDPVKGVSALQRVGVSFTESQKKQIQTLVDSGKTLEAQKIILKELGKEFGGAAEAAATPSQKLAVTMGNVKEAIGTALLPAVDKAANGVRIFFDALTGQSEMNEFDGALKVLNNAGIVTAAIFGKVKDVLSIFLAALTGKSELNEFDGALKKVNNAGIAVGRVFRTVFKGIKVFFDALTGRSELNEFDGALKTVNNAGIALREVFAKVADFVTGSLLPSIVNLYKLLQPLLAQAFGVVVKAVRALIPAIFAVGGAVKPVTGFLKQHKTIVQAVAVAVLAGVVAFKLWRGAILAWSAVTKAAIAVQTAFNVVMSANPVMLVVVALAALAAGLIYAYKHSETFRNIVDKAFHVVGQAFDFVKDHWKLFLAVLLPALIPIVFMATQIAKHWDTTKAILARAFGAVGSAAQGMWNNVLKPTFRFMADAWFTVVGALVNGAAKAFGWVPGIGPKLRDAAKKFNTFRDKVNASLDGIHNNVSVVVTAIYRDPAHGDSDYEHRASGGRMIAGRPYIWAEPSTHGELFVPDVNGTAVNRQQLAAAMAGAPTGAALTIERLEVMAAPDERAETSVPRGLQSLLFTAGLRGG